jgi:uncharacterized membrane protein YccC
MLVRPVVGAITALPVVAVFALGLGLGSARAAIAMALGANLIAVVSLVGAPRLSLRLALIDAFAMGLSVFVGSVTGPYPWLHALVLVPWCFAAGMLVVFGQAQATVGTQSIIAFLVIGRFAEAPLASFHTALLVIAGSLVEVLALVTLRLPPSLHHQRTRLAESFDALADLALRPPDRSTVDVAATIDDADRTLSSPSLFGRTDARELRAVLDQARRIRLELSTLAGLRARLSADGSRGAEAAIGACLEDAAAALGAIGAALRHPEQAMSWQAAAGAYQQRLAEFEAAVAQADPTHALGPQQSVAALAAIGGQIRAAGNLVEAAGAGGMREAWRPSIAIPGIPTPGRLRREARTVLENLHAESPAFRHAVRLAIAVPASAVLASWLALPRSFWVPYAVAVILKPDYSTLFGRGIGRIAGTVLGVTLAAVLISGLHPNEALTTVLVALTAWAAYSTWVASFPVGIGFVTALVLILLSTALPNPVSTAADRLADVVLGGAIAAAAYLIWPTSPRAAVGDAQSDLFAALGSYLDLVFEVIEGRPVARSAIAARSRANRVAWANAEAAVGRAIQEPSSTRIDPSKNRGLIATALRIARASHALRIEAEHGARAAAFGELEALRAGLVVALDTLAAHFGARTAGQLPDLRSLYRSVEQSPDAVLMPRSIALHLDELVNAIDTAAYLAGLTEPAPHQQAPA